MKKLMILFCFIFIIGAFPFVASANTTCATKYPIVLVHGMAYTGDGMLGIGYFYNIPSTLTGKGAKVFVSNQTAMAATSDRAAQLKTYVLQVLATTKAAKVNLVAHSQGGLDSRYMISNLGMSSKVATLTTIDTPHRGSAVADVLLGLDADVGGWITQFTDVIYNFMFGGKNNAAATALDLSRPYMKNVFNPNTPDKSGVLYQSWAGKINYPCVLNDKLIFVPTGALLVLYEGGDNDGMVSVASAKWGNFKGTQSGTLLGGGVSHINIVDQLLGVTPGFDAPGFYVSIVSDLKNKKY